MVARVRRAFQVSHGSVETLFRWGKKRLHLIAANLFRISESPYFCRRYYRKHLVFFSGHTAYGM